MDYSKVDKSFSEWANCLKLLIQNDYKGDEVRSVDIFDEHNQKWQLWLVPVNESDKCVIHYWNYSDISRHVEVDNSQLFDELSAIGENVKNGTIPKAKLP
ncbi:hypothetical protein [Rheinheimera sp. 1928-s]|uniref:hypothetical protein n=1 Tax=Rheinheimera sp. 1928-s TaxID=3033803 RepID=UPI002607A3EE|nr:hypothetical protein [Rheinheimera sp. 1928-s]MDF3126513.1 hypothetical protein [Rheinheimera sp. 1928-s]